MPAPWHPDFQTRYEAALIRSKERKISRRDINARPMSVAWLIDQYRQTDDFNALAPSTKKDKSALMLRVETAWGETDIRTITAYSLGSELDDAITSPNVRNRVRGIFSQILKYAVKRGYIPTNPVNDIERAKTTTTGTHGWTPDERKRFLDHHPEGSRPRLAFLLLFETVQRSSDVVRMGRDNIDGDEITGQQVKTGTTYRVPMSDELKTAIEQIRDRETFLITGYGEPFSAKGFQQLFGKWCDEAGLPKKCRGHGLRVAGCEELAESGASAPEFMAISGHKTLAEAEKYIRNANKKKLAQVAANKRARSRLNGE